MTKRKNYLPDVSTTGGLTVARAPSAGMRYMSSEDKPLSTTAPIAPKDSRRKPHYNLDELLAGFDPERHGGELMAFLPVGLEKL